MRLLSVALLYAVAVAALCVASFAEQVPAPSRYPIEQGLAITRPDGHVTERLGLTDVLAVLKIPSVSVALIDHDRLAWAHAFGEGASPRTLYQAASLSKTVTAVAALRRVQHGRLRLDRDVSADLTEWHIPPSDLSRDHPVTLRGLLSMTGGIGVPGYLGYERGAPLPNLIQILDGTPPANSPPVRVEYVPGSRYAYSGGGYEIVQAMIQDATHRSFEDALNRLVLRPAGMADSHFIQPLSAALIANAATGHRADGTELPGGWRVVPELAAGGLWSTPTDLARLLIEISRAWRGEPNPVLSLKSSRIMLTAQNKGPDGLGGAVSGSGRSLVFMKRGQNIGYQSYMLIFPETGQGIVVMTGSDNGTTLATGIIRRAAIAYGWPPLGELLD
jgi:CubicO group peptidase (beta-lactamase class C family)